MSSAKRFCRNPNTLERKLATKTLIFETLFFSDSHLYQDYSFGIRFDQPIRFVFKDNLAFPNASLLIVEYSLAAIFEREIEGSCDESDSIHWQMTNFRIGLLKQSLKLESTFTPSHPKVDETTFRSNLIKFFPDQIELSKSVDISSLSTLKWMEEPMDENHASMEVMKIQDAESINWFPGLGERIFELLVDKHLLNTAEDVTSQNYFTASPHLNLVIKGKAIKFIKQIYDETHSDQIFLSQSVFDTISADCDECGNTYYCYHGAGRKLVNPLDYRPPHQKCDSCKGNFIF